MENKKKTTKKKKFKYEWEQWKLKFFLSSYAKAYRFLLDEKYITQSQLDSGHFRGKIAGWDMEKKEWEKQALEVTMSNLKDAKIVEMTNFIAEEGQVVKQLLNMAKIAMNNLVTKGTVKGKEVLELKNVQGLKQVSESVLNILKYGRDRLGIPFEKEEEGLKKATNFNFDYVNLDDFDPEQVIDLFKKKDAKQNDKQPIKTDVVSPIPEIVDGKE